MTDPDVQARAYARIRYRLLLINLVAGLGVLAAFQWSGASRALARWLTMHLPSEPGALLGYLAVFGVMYYVAMFPLHFYGSFRLEHRFGLSRMTPQAWWIREIKQVVLSAVIGALLVEALYALLRHAPRSWPFWASLGWIGFTIVMARVFPTLLLPIFYKTVPLEDLGLSQRLLNLCQRVGLPALGVFRVALGVETRKANAALAGMGKTRRVLVSDTLLAQFTPEEIESVLAHELAHHHYRHILKMLVVSAIGSSIAFSLTALLGQRWVGPLGLRDLADIAGFPALMLWLSVLGLVGLPLQNALSRHFEWQADRFAVVVTSVPRAFAEALQRLARLNLADPNPPRWVEWFFYDHPRISERIRVAKASTRHPQ